MYGEEGEGVDKVTGGIGECGMQLGFRRFIYLGEKLLSCVISRIFFLYMFRRIRTNYRREEKNIRLLYCYDDVCPRFAPCSM